MKIKKILCVLFFVILFCLLGFSKCFAYSDDVNDYPKPDASVVGNHLYVIQIQNGKLRLSVFTDTTLGIDKLYSVYSNKYGSHYFSTVPEDDNINIAVSYYKLNDDSSSWIADGSWHDCHYDQKSGDHIIYSRVDVFNKDGTVFFHPSPLTLVARQVETVEMSQVLQEIVGVLPLIIALLVSLVGLRKALKMLVTFLRQS